jgi:hypothetical protein
VKKQPQGVVRGSVYKEASCCCHCCFWQSLQSLQRLLRRILFSNTTRHRFSTGPTPSYKLEVVVTCILFAERGGLTLSHSGRLILFFWCEIPGYIDRPQSLLFSVGRYCVRRKKKSVGVRAALQKKTNGGLPKTEI